MKPNPLSVPCPTVDLDLDDLDIEEPVWDGKITFDMLPRCDKCGRWTKMDNYTVVPGCGGGHLEPPEQILLCPRCFNDYEERKKAARNAAKEGR